MTFEPGIESSKFGEPFREPAFPLIKSIEHLEPYHNLQKLFEHLLIRFGTSHLLVEKIHCSYRFLSN